MEYIPIVKMVVDFFTKNIPREKHNYYLQELKLGSIVGVHQFLKKENLKSINRELVGVNQGWNKSLLRYKEVQLKGYIYNS